MRKIVLINQSTGYLFKDIANEFATVYDEVILMTGSKIKRHDLQKNIQLVAIYPYNKKSTITRFSSWIIGFVQILLNIRIGYKNYELFVSSNPPLATLLPLFCKNKTSLLIYDVYPDGLVSGGFVSGKNLIYRFWAYLNRKSYLNVSKILSITDGMTKLLSKYTRMEKIEMIPVWADRTITDFNKNGVNRFQAKYDLENKFIVMYSGNMGKNHALESLVHVAENLKDNEQIHFVFAGEGWKKNLVVEMVKELELENCTILSYMPKDLFISSLYGIDIGVISLGENTSKIAIPSKTFNLLAAGNPLLCFANKSSDLAKLVEENNVGETFSHHEIDEATEYVKIMSESNSSRKDQLSINAEIASKNFSFKNATKIAELIYNLHHTNQKR